MASSPKYNKHRRLSSNYQTTGGPNRPNKVLLIAILVCVIYIIYLNYYIIHDDSTSNNKLLMIPGPTEFHPDVYKSLASPTLSHVAPSFINIFGETLERLRLVLKASKRASPVVMSGSGSLGWDMIIANFMSKDDIALVINTGYFSDSFADAFDAYGHTIYQVYADRPGNTVSNEDIMNGLKTAEKKFGKQVKLVALTHVDTSTGVINDIEQMSKVIREYSSDILIAVDGVCSFGGAKFNFEEWKIDAAFTGSQKAFGVPPGLMVLMCSERAIKVLNNRKTRPPTYYGDLKRWLPIMKAYEERRPSYYATPAVNLITALHTALGIMLQNNLNECINKHYLVANAFREVALSKWGIRSVPVTKDIAAPTLSALYYPENIEAAILLTKIKEHGVIVAGGLHKDLKTKYFRVGHMGYSVCSRINDVYQTVKSIGDSLYSLEVSSFNGEQSLTYFKQLLKQ